MEDHPEKLHSLLRAHRDAGEIVGWLTESLPRAIADRVCCTEDEGGNLPLHSYFISEYCSSIAVLDTILSLNPAASRHTNAQGQLPLLIALTSRVSKSTEIFKVWEAHPAAAREVPIHLLLSSRPEAVSDKLLEALLVAHPAGMLELKDHLEVLARASVGRLEVLYRLYPQCARPYNGGGKSPLQVALSLPTSASPSFDSLLWLQQQNPQGVAPGALSAIADMEQRAAFAAMVALTQPIGRTSSTTVSLHLLGDSFAGKSSCKIGLLKTMVTRPLANLFRAAGEPSRVHADDRTIGLVVERLEQPGIFHNTRYLVHDYGGHAEFLVTHQSFLSAAPNPIFLILVALWDEKREVAISDEEVLSRYAGWVRFLYCVANKRATTPRVITVINFGNRVSKKDPRVITRVTNLLERWQNTTWSPSEILFITPTIALEAVELASFKVLNRAISQSVQFLSQNQELERVPACEITRVALSAMHRGSWPRLAQLDTFIVEVLRPLLLGEMMSKTRTFSPHVHKVVDRLVTFVLNQLVSLGEIIIFSKFIVTDVSYAASKLLGRIFRSDALAGRIPRDASADAAAYASGGTYLTTEQIRERTLSMQDDPSDAELSISEARLLPSLLCEMGLCIPVPAAAPEVGAGGDVQSQEPTRFTIPAMVSTSRNAALDCLLNPRATRVVHRRWRLADRFRGIFPPAFFSQLFGGIARLEPESMRMKLFSDGLDLTSSYAREESGVLLKNEVQIIVLCALHSFSFDVIVCGGPAISPTDDRIWRRMLEIRQLVASTGVPLIEFCVHPLDPRSDIAFHALPAARDRDEECKSFVYGTLNGGAAEEHEEGEGGSGDERERRRVGQLLDLSLRQQLTGVANLLKTIISKRFDLPCLPFIALAPPKTGLRVLIDTAKNVTHHRWRLFFVSPVSLKVAPSGPRGRGYKIESPRAYVNKLLPLLQISCVVISIALKQLGVPISLPFPVSMPGSVPGSATLLDSGAFLASARQLLCQAVADPQAAVAEARDRANDAAGQLVRTKDGEEEADPLATIKEACAGGAPPEISDAKYEELAELLRACGDPLPNNRPLFSGLTGPIVSQSGDGAVAWVLAEEVTDFQRLGAACFARENTASE